MATDSPSFKPPIREKGRYIFPYPYLAVVTAEGLGPEAVRIPTHPPPERGNLILQAAIGNPRLEELKEDILLASKYYGDKPNRIFLAGETSLAAQTDALLEALKLCTQVFPNLDRVSVQGETKLLLEKGLEDVRSLRGAGLKKLYLRLETGDDELRTGEGATSTEMIRAAEMVREAGIELSVSVRLGIGGEGSWKRNAELTAKVLNAMRPSETRLHHLIVQPDSQLQERIMRGEFKEASRYEVLKEMRELVSLLDYETRLHTHRLMFPGLPVERKLPEEKERILGVLSFALSYFFGEAVDPGIIQKYSMLDVLEWDGQEDVAFRYIA